MRHDKCIGTELLSKLSEWKRKNRMTISNVIYSKIQESTLYDIWECDGGIAFIVDTINKKNVYYIAQTENSLQALLQEAPQDVILEFFHKEVEDDGSTIFTPCGYVPLTKYIRCTTVYEQNPYASPEEGRRAVLCELYDPTTKVEKPTMEDIPIIIGLWEKHFDPRVDDYYTSEEWSQLIREDQCLVHKENGMVQAVYVYRLEGKKLYSSIAINEGPADWLYNLERFVFEKMWSNGIRTYYAWFDIRNKKALNRGNKNWVFKSRSWLYDSIYIKADKL